LDTDALQNYEKMGTEFILPLLFYENIDILLYKNSQGSLNAKIPRQCKFKRKNANIK
jgi:hypothetical protein